MNLYVDIGNTNIKMTYKEKEASFFYLPTNKKYTIESLYKQLDDYLKKIKLDNIYLVSVVPSLTSIFESMFEKYFDITIIKFEHPFTNVKLNLNVDVPQKIGADLVCLAKFTTTYSKRAIIINMGTATTLIYIKNNSLEGAIIMPGYKIALNSLLNSAEQLDQTELQLQKNQHIGKNTKEALSIGMINGTAHAIKGLVNDIDKEADLYISGGNAHEVESKLENFEYIKEATLKGLVEIFKEDA